MIYFCRNMNISSNFYFSKSTSIYTQYSSLWDTLKMMLFTKYLIKWKRIGRISWKFWYWFDLISSLELDIKRLMLYLSNAPLIVIVQNAVWKWETEWIQIEHNIVFFDIKIFFDNHFTPFFFMHFKTTSKLPEPLNVSNFFFTYLLKIWMKRPQGFFL